MSGSTRWATLNAASSGRWTVEVIRTIPWTSYWYAPSIGDLVASVAAGPDPVVGDQVADPEGQPDRDEVRDQVVDPDELGEDVEGRQADDAGWPCSGC